MVETIPATSATQRIYEAESILKLSKDWFYEMSENNREKYLSQQFDMKYDIIKYDIVEQFINRDTNSKKKFDLIIKIREMIEVSPDLFSYNNYKESSNAIIYDQYKLFIQHDSLEFYTRLSKSPSGQFFLDKFNGKASEHDPSSDQSESSFLLNVFSDIDDILTMLDKIHSVIKNPNITIIKLFRNY